MNFSTKIEHEFKNSIQAFIQDNPNMNQKDWLSWLTLDELIRF